MAFAFVLTSVSREAHLLHRRDRHHADLHSPNGATRVERRSEKIERLLLSATVLAVFHCAHDRVDGRNAHAVVSAADGGRERPYSRQRDPRTFCRPRNAVHGVDGDIAYRDLARLQWFGKRAERAHFHSRIVRAVGHLRDRVHSGHPDVIRRAPHRLAEQVQGRHLDLGIVRGERDRPHPVHRINPDSRVGIAHLVAERDQFRQRSRRTRLRRCEINR